MNPSDIQKKVRELGYDVVTDKKEFVITGMTCAACSTRIEKGLNKMDGVVQANVNLALEKATVEFNPSAVSTKELIQKVEKLGYGAMLKVRDEKETVDHRQKEIEKQQGKFIYSLLFFHCHYCGQWLGILVLHPLLGSRCFYESMGADGIGNTCSIYYW